MEEGFPRRQLLGLTALGLAGCASQPPAESGTTDRTREGSTTTTTSPDEATTNETPTQTETTTTGEPVEVTTEVSLRTPDASGELAYDVSIDAGEPVEGVRVRTPAAAVEHDGDGTETTVSGVIDAQPGVLNAVSVSTTVETGGETTLTAQQYARKYTRTAEPTVDVGSVYVPFMGSEDDGKWANCVVGTPRIGPYSTDEDDYDDENRAAVARHLDQQQGHACGPVMFNFGEEGLDYGRYEVFQRSDLAAEITFECFYVLIQALRRNRSVRLDLEFVRDTMFELDTYSTLDGRPLVQFWGGFGARWFLEDDPLFEDKSPSEHVDWIRDTLTPDDGPEPFLVTTTGAYGRWRERDDADPDERTNEYMAAFDGYTTWFPHLETGETTDWSDALAATEAEFSALNALAETEGKAVIPTVYPGFDDRGNDCWGEDRYLPRSVDRFRDLLELADEYRTHDRINVASWNDWNEGHMIEPGAHEGTDYGTAYLEVIENRYLDS